MPSVFTAEQRESIARANVKAAAKAGIISLIITMIVVGVFWPDASGLVLVIPVAVMGATATWRIRKMRSQS